MSPTGRITTTLGLRNPESFGGIMGCPFILLTVGLLVWANIATVQLFTQRHAKAGWWIGLAVAWAVGAGIGVWSGFFFEYQVSPTLRVFGFPVPAAFFHYEGSPGQEQWIDFITPAPILFAGSNILIVGMLAACPVGLAFWLWGERRDFRRSGCSNDRMLDAGDLR